MKYPILRSVLVVLCLLNSFAVQQVVYSTDSHQDNTAECVSPYRKTISTVATGITVGGMYALLGSLIYSTTYGFCDSFFKLVPFLTEEYVQRLSNVSSVLTTAGVIGASYLLMGRLPWQTAYMLYSGERLSPQCALAVLQEIKSYVHYIVLIDKIRDQISTLVHSIEDHKHLLATQECVLSFELLKTHVAVITNISERHQTTLAYAALDLDRFLESVAERQEWKLYSYESRKACQIDYSWIDDVSLRNELESFVATFDTIYARLESSEVIGEEVTVLQDVTKNLLVYWQDVVRGAYRSIQDNLRECRVLYSLEQFIIQRLNRPLCVAETALVGKYRENEEIE